ncbi:MAG: sodium/proline symporter [Fidelibacterota bacterium]
MGIITITFIAYLVLILVIGFITSRQTKNIKDFALGGNRLGPVVIAFSERASGESAWLIVGLPGAALMAGLLELWTVVGCVTGIILSWIIIAKPLRRITEQYGALTLPELLAKRFNDEDGTIRWLSSLIITFFFTFYVAAQFSGAGKVLHVTFNLTHMQGMVIGAVIIICYTILGGFLAVAWTDLVQGIIMIGTLVILPLTALVELPSVVGSAPIMDWSTIFGSQIGWGAIIAAIGGLSWGLGYLGQPHLVARYMAINSVKNIGISRRIAIAWAVPAFFGSLFIGLLGARLLSAGFFLVDGRPIHILSDPEQLMPLMATHLLNPWLAGVLISGAIAAMMSTADSQLLVSTTILTEDVVGKWYQKKNRTINYLALGRVFTLLIGLVAFIFAWRSTNLVFEMVSYAWSGLGASFGPAIVLTLWWRKTTKQGVVAGMITGAVTTVIWSNIPILQQVITERFTSFILAFAAVVIVSILTSSRNEK